MSRSKIADDDECLEFDFMLAWLQARERDRSEKEKGTSLPLGPFV